MVETSVDVSAEAKLRASCIWSLWQFINICDHAGLFLTVSQAKAAAAAGEYFLVCYQKLAWAAHSSGHCLWKVRPKLHYFAHLCDSVRRRRLNPRRYDLFGAEDFMKKVKRLTKSCHRSTARCAVVRRYTWFLAHRWHKKINRPSWGISAPDTEFGH